MIAYHRFGGHIDVHRAGDVTGAIQLAGGSLTANAEHAEEVGDAQHSTVGTGIFAPRALHKERSQQHHTQHDQPANGHFSAPKVEERIIGINRFKDERAGGSGHIDHPGQHQIAQVAQHTIHFGRDEVIVAAFLEDLAANAGHPLLNRAQGANPTAEDGAKKKRRQKDNDHQHKRGLMHLLHESTRRGIFIERLHPAKGADRMQRGTGQERNALARFYQCVVDRYEGDQRKEEPLHHAANPDISTKK